MKRSVIIIICFLCLYSTRLYTEEINQSIKDVTINHLPGQQQYATTSSESLLAEDPKKVFIHYMGWYGAGEAGRHWKEGHAHTPLIGEYSSHSWPVLMYHMLLSWSCGIDGLIINVKDEYDQQCLNTLFSTINILKDIDSSGFKYKFAVSYDDQGMDKVGIDTALDKFKYLRENILPNTKSYLKYNDTASVFIWNYKENKAKNLPEYLTAGQYNTALDSIFPEGKLKVLWNEIDSGAFKVANSFYPWVQGFDPDGLNWGKEYLDWYYPAIASNPNIDFATAGVWPGFNDSLCSWGEERWIDRQAGKVYDSTWSYIKNYSGPLPLQWVYIETWNDWNEGTEIEPSKECGYKYLQSTIDHINLFKETTIPNNTETFEAALKIYEASASIESSRCDSMVYFPLLKRAIMHFFLGNNSEVLSVADSIVNRIQPFATDPFLKGCNWDDTTLWSTYKHDDAGVILNFTNYEGENNDGLQLDFVLPVKYSWVCISHNVSFDPETTPITFLIKANISNNKSIMELKFVDDSGRVFMIEPNLSYFKDCWYRVVVYPENSEYRFGGPDSGPFGKMSKFEIAIHTDSVSSGTVFIDEIGEGIEGLESSFYYEGYEMDPDSVLPGIGFSQRRSSSMNSEDVLVYKYLKLLQEQSPNKSTLGSYNGDNSYHTFDNSLAAMAFIAKSDSVRAGKILDFYAERTDTNNTDIALQNFFYRPSVHEPVEARGYYQRVYFDTDKAMQSNDRWVGDMVWLAMAYRQYLAKFCYKEDYQYVITLIEDLLRSYYKPVGNDKGYIQSGWRNSDSKLHDTAGHEEGNIDCYAFFKPIDDTFALYIKNWIDDTLQGRSGLPLDLYSWRVLAYGKGAEKLLNIPEYDFRYRKELGDSICGFLTGYSEFRNIWPDGTAHMASAYLNYGDSLRGYFYANQLDKLIIADTINGTEVHSIPYFVRNIGGHCGIDVTKGSLSAAAWYILVKNKINPLFGEIKVNPCHTSIIKKPEEIAFEISPNPANEIIYIKALNNQTYTVQVLDIQGKIVTDKKQMGQTGTIDVSDLSTGVYFVKVIQEDNLFLQKIIVK
jgi:hypothetical protein